MKTNKKSIEIIKLDESIMDCFVNKEEMAIVTGGKGILDKILDIIDIEINNCSNGNCGC